MSASTFSLLLILIPLCFAGVFLWLLFNASFEFSSLNAGVAEWFCSRRDPRIPGTVGSTQGSNPCRQHSGNPFGAGGKNTWVASDRRYECRPHEGRREARTILLTLNPKLLRTV